MFDTTFGAAAAQTLAARAPMTHLAGATVHTAPQLPSDDQTKRKAAARINDHKIALRLLGEGAHRSALVAALIFGVHPIASEPVNYISSRSELLVAFLLLASLSVFLRRRAQGGLSLAGVDGTLGLILGGYGAALLSKATAVALPAVILVHDLLFRRDMVRRDPNLYGGMALMSGLYLWVIMGQFHKATIDSPVRGYDEQLWSQVKALLLYLRLLLFPTGLSVDHQFLISDYIFFIMLIHC